MKTNLPEQITTAEEAKAFLTELYKNGEAFHPDDDAQQIAFEDGRTFTSTEAKKLNALMEQCYDLLPDPCEVLMDLVEAEKIANENSVIIRVFCGVSVEDKCGSQLHPLNEVIKAQKSISLNKSLDFFSNSTDFVSAIKYLCQENDINCEFYLDGESLGNNLEPLFENLNKGIDLLYELCPNIS